MNNITTYPLEDSFETTLAQAWDGAVGTINVNTTPDFTFPSSTTTYVVVNPGKSNAQIAEINAFDAGLNTLTVSNITLETGAGTSSTQQTHGVGSTLIISDNFQFWQDIVTATNTKLDDDGGNAGVDWGDEFFIDLTGVASSEIFLGDSTTPKTSLAALAAGAWTDTKVSVSVNDTTPGVLDAKLTAGDGLTKTIINPAGDEDLDLDIDTSDTAIFVKTSSGAGDEDKVPVLDSAGKLDGDFLNGQYQSATESVEGVAELATQAEVDAGTDDTRIVTPLKLADKLLTTPIVGKVKTADDNVTTSVTDDTHLVGFALDTNSYYKVEGHYRFSCGTTEVGRFTFTFPAWAEFRISCTRGDQNQNDTEVFQESADEGVVVIDVASGTTGTPQHFVGTISGYIFTAGTAGDFDLQHSVDSGTWTLFEWTWMAITKLA